MTSSKIVSITYPAVYIPIAQGTKQPPMDSQELRKTWGSIDPSPVKPMCIRWSKLAKGATNKQAASVAQQFAIVFGTLSADKINGSSPLIGLDCDDEGFLKEFLALNPWALDTLSTKGARGQLFLFRVVGWCKTIHLKDTRTEPFKPLGELRGTGAYSVMPPSIHPSGVAYSIVQDKPLVTIDIQDIKWPEYVRLPAALQKLLGIQNASTSLRDQVESKKTEAITEGDQLMASMGNKVASHLPPDPKDDPYSHLVPISPIQHIGTATPTDPPYPHHPPTLHGARERSKVCIKERSTLEVGAINIGNHDKRGLNNDILYYPLEGPLQTKDTPTGCGVVGDTPTGCDMVFGREVCEGVTYKSLVYPFKCHARYVSNSRLISLAAVVSDYRARGIELDAALVFRVWWALSFKNVDPAHSMDWFWVKFSQLLLNSSGTAFGRAWVQAATLTPPGCENIQDKALRRLCGLCWLLSVSGKEAFSIPVRWLSLHSGWGNKRAWVLLCELVSMGILEKSSGSFRLGRRATKYTWRRFSADQKRKW